MAAKSKQHYRFLRLNEHLREGDEQLSAGRWWTVITLIAQSVYQLKRFRRPISPLQAARERAKAKLVMQKKKGVALPATMKEWSKAVFENAKAHGFHHRESDAKFIESFCNNQHGEVTELYEAYRSGKLHKLCDKAEGMTKLGVKPLTCIQEEVADMVSRAFGICGRFGLDPEEILYAKHVYNVHRPHRHGGKKT